MVFHDHPREEFFPEVFSVFKGSEPGKRPADGGFLGTAFAGQSSSRFGDRTSWRVLRADLLNLGFAFFLASFSSGPRMAAVRFISRQ